MVSLCLGIAAFILYFLYDINSIRWKRSFPRWFFALGTAALVVSLLLDLYTSVSSDDFSGPWDWVLIVLSVVFLVLLIYTLFFAIPFEESYTRQSEDRFVYSEGVYALCRHPGILFFFLMYMPLGLAALPDTGLLIHGFLFSLLNLLYALFQDRITFPGIFCDYPQYQQRTPFLIPTNASWVQAFRIFRKKNKKEVE